MPDYINMCLRIFATPIEQGFHTDELNRSILIAKQAYELITRMNDNLPESCLNRLLFHKKCSYLYL